MRARCVPVALDGAHLPGGVKIKKGKLRGVASNGMLCSGAELDCTSGTVSPRRRRGHPRSCRRTYDARHGREGGASASDDDVIDFEILANRPDCLSVWGMARESARPCWASTSSMPEIPVEENGEGAFEDYATVERARIPTSAPATCARVITNVRIGPSPKWMREYLYGAGVRPINNIVDITNFVMLETGQPMHAFDLSARCGTRPSSCAGRARARRMTTLDGKEHILDETHAGHRRRTRTPTGLAGIMGGEESEIVDDTARRAVRVRRLRRAPTTACTARTLGMRTEASGRFEKGV